MVEFGEKSYTTFKALCEAHGLSDSKVRRRLNLGWTLAEALGVIFRENKSKLNARKIQIEVQDPVRGILEFNTIKDAASFYGISYDLVIQRIQKHKWTYEQALNLEPPPKRKAHNALYIEIDGKVFKSRTDCAFHYGIDQRLVHTRLKRCWTLKEALEIDSRKQLATGPNHLCNIYQICNLLDGKIYIGVTINSITDRFNQHVYSSTKSARLGTLQNAIYQFGRDNFELKLLDVVELKDLAEKEKFWIKAKSSMFPKGYNQNAGGAGVGGEYISKGIVFKEKTYNSVAEIAREYQIKPQTLSARLRNMSLELALEKPFRKSPKSNFKG